MPDAGQSILELIKLINDYAQLKDAADKGMLNWKVVLAGLGFAAFLFGTLIPAWLYYQNHPAAKNLFYAVLAIDAVAYIAVMIFSYRWYQRGVARWRASQEAASTAAASAAANTETPAQ
jgi:membrane protease YdiL (CAAX protease family)